MFAARLGCLACPKPVNGYRDSNSSARRFGTFGGVFTPCMLTILGVIMFLRLGQVVGQSGILWAAAIVLMSAGITTLTSLSLSAIATNTRVKGGGAYYLISRSLGVESWPCVPSRPWWPCIG